MKIKTITKAILIIGLAGAVQIQAMNKHHNKKQPNKTTKFLTNNQKNRCRDETKQNNENTKLKALALLNDLVKTNKNSKELLKDALPFKDCAETNKNYNKERFIFLIGKLQTNKRFICSTRDKEVPEIIKTLNDNNNAYIITKINNEIEKALQF